MTPRRLAAVLSALAVVGLAISLLPYFDVRLDCEDYAGSPDF